MKIFSISILFIGSFFFFLLFVIQRKIISNVIGEQLFWILFVSIMAIALGIIVFRLTKVYINWKYDRLIITNQRTVNIDQHFIFSVDVTAILIKDIVNMNSFHKGIMASFFQFGTMVIETNAAEVSCNIPYIPDPDGVIRIIHNLKANQKYYNRSKGKVPVSFKPNYVKDSKQFISPSIQDKQSNQNKKQAQKESANHVRKNIYNILHL
jgi:hypothetical protein